MTMGELSAADVAAVTRPNFMGYGMGCGGFGMGGWEGIIGLIVLAGIFGGGFGGFGGNGGGWQQGFNTQNILSKLDGITNGISDATYALNNSINGINMNLSNALCSTTYELAGKIDANRFATQQGFGNIERAIDGINYNNTQNTQRVLDKLCSIEMNQKDQRIAELMHKNTQQEFIISQTNQNSYLVNKLQPCPIPAYQVANPNCCYNPCGCNGYQQ